MPASFRDDGVRLVIADALARGPLTVKRRSRVERLYNPAGKVLPLKLNVKGMRQVTPAADIVTNRGMNSVRDAAIAKLHTIR